VGIPLAATFATEEIFTAFLAPYEEFKTFFHGHTYTGNALACAVALANLDLFEKDDVIARVGERTAEFETLLEEHIAPLAHVGDIRRWGLMTGIEIVRERATRQPFDTRLKVGQRAVMAARRRGVLIRPLGSVMILMPPLSSRHSSSLGFVPQRLNQSAKSSQL
jgi:adenosylmethionine-8-amino-7-oxononanoate aminotransferase